MRYRYEADDICRLLPVDWGILDIPHGLLSMFCFSWANAQSLYATLFLVFQACVHMFPILALLAVWHLVKSESRLRN